MHIYGASVSRENFPYEVCVGGRKKEKRWRDGKMKGGDGETPRRGRRGGGGEKIN